MLKYLCVVLISLYGLNRVSAHECDAALIKTVYNSAASHHEDWRLSILITEDNYSQAKAEAHGDAVIYGVPVGVDYKQYNENRKKVFNLHNESRTVDEMRSVALTTLGSEAAGAYSKCLNSIALSKDGLHAEIVSTTKSDISILVRWFVPNGPGKAHVVWTPSSVEGVTLQSNLPQGLTTIRIPRPQVQMTLLGNFGGYTTGSITLEPPPSEVPPFVKQEAPRPKIIIVNASEFDRSASINVDLASGTAAVFGDGVLLNAPPYGHRRNAAEWKFDVPVAGVYKLQIEYASGEWRPVSIRINGQPWMESALGTPTCGFTSDCQSWHDLGSVSLKEGIQTIRLSREDVFPHVRTLQFIPE